MGPLKSSGCRGHCRIRGPLQLHLAKIQQRLCLCFRCEKVQPRDDDADDAHTSVRDHRWKHVQERTLCTSRRVLEGYPGLEPFRGIRLNDIGVESLLELTPTFRQCISESAMAH